MSGVTISIEKLQEIARPLDSRLEHYGFKIDGEPLMDGPIRMVSFKGSDGQRLDYCLEVKEDIERGQYNSKSEVELSVRLFLDGVPVELFPYKCFGSNRPIISALNYIAENQVEPNLRRHLHR